MQRFFLIIVGWILSLSVSHAFFCPSNFNAINLSDSEANVLAACGKPTTSESHTKAATAVEDWMYFIYQQQNVTKLHLIFKNQQLININLTANRSIISPECDRRLRGLRFIDQLLFQQCVVTSTDVQNLTYTNACGGRIQVGANTEVVKMRCGEPAYINQRAVQSAQITVDEWHYQNNTPKATLIFENDQLTDRRFD